MDLHGSVGLLLPGLNSITAMGRPYFDLGLPTKNNERTLVLPTLSYKKLRL